MREVKWEHGSRGMHHGVVFIFLAFCVGKKFFSPNVFKLKSPALKYVWLQCLTAFLKDEK